MAKFTVDSDLIQSAVSAVQTDIESVRTATGNLTNQLLNLQASWQGQAQTAFQGVVEQWKSTQSQVEQSIESINSALAAAGTHYGNTEVDVIRLFAV
ncbi:WXG100 family type VII secretion target [Gulosibacter faecalis]|jgi:WXG100 family type VII secretion target|uniref:ESAT-6-like protein n=1 Tax=Gulosibacter faecalis TaxID=272240 RepID=A0ABW5UX85_9MICO|nr:WXG100 family type VII secretion target [Gulosibacter faecalis]